MARKKIGVSRRAPSQSFVRVLDSYYRPVADDSAERNARYLSRALNILDSSVSRKARQDQIRNEQEEKLLGTQQAMKDALASDDGKQIRAGDKYPQASYAFMAGYQQQLASSRAHASVLQFATDYETLDPDIKNSDDPSVFNNYVTNWMTENMEKLGDNPYAAAGAMPVFREAIYNIQTKHQAYTRDRLKTNVTSAFEEEAAAMLMNPSMEGDTVDWNGTILGIIQKGNNLYEIGVDGATITETTANLLMNYAEATEDLDLLAATLDLQGQKTPDGRTFRFTAETLNKIDATQDRIQSELDARARSEAAERKALQEAADDNALGLYTTALLEVDPTKPLPMPPKDLARSNPDLYKSMMTMRTNITTANKPISEAAEQAALMGMLTTLNLPENAGMTTSQKLDFVNNQISQNNIQMSAGTLMRLYSDITKTADVKALINNPRVKSFRSSITALFNSKNDGALYPGTNGEAAATFIGHFNSFLNQYEIGGKDLTQDPDAMLKLMNQARDYAIDMMRADAQFVEERDLFGEFSAGQRDILGLNRTSQTNNDTENGRDAEAMAELDAILNQPAEGEGSLDAAAASAMPEVEEPAAPEAEDGQSIGDMIVDAINSAFGSEASSGGRNDARGMPPDDGSDAPTPVNNTSGGRNDARVSAGGPSQSMPSEDSTPEPVAPEETTPEPEASEDNSSPTTVYQSAIDMLITDEGFSSTQYPDSGGMSVGHGLSIANLTPDELELIEDINNVQPDESKAVVAVKVNKILAELGQYIPGFGTLPDHTKQAIIGMSYQLGVQNVLARGPDANKQWPKFITAVRAAAMSRGDERQNNLETAASHMLNNFNAQGATPTAWAVETPNRARKMANLLKGN